MKKNKLRKSVIVTGGLLISLFIIIISILVVKNLNSEKILKEEINKITNLDFTTDEIDMNIKSRNDYGVVEKTIKEFWQEYYGIAREIVLLMQDDKIQNILTIDNFQKDGKEFIKTKEFISTTQEKINTDINKLIELNKKENIENAIKDKGLSETYVNLYNELMVNYDIEEDIATTVKELEGAQSEVNDLFTYYMKVIDFLVENQNNWTVNEEKIEFTNQNLVDQYNDLVNERENITE